MSSLFTLGLHPVPTTSTQAPPMSRITSNISSAKHKFKPSKNKKQKSQQKHRNSTETASTFSSDSTFISSFSSFPRRLSARVRRRWRRASQSTQNSLPGGNSRTVSSSHMPSSGSATGEYVNASHRASRASTGSTPDREAPVDSGTRRRSSRLWEWLSAGSASPDAIETMRQQRMVDEEMRRDTDIVYYAQFGL